MTYPDRNYDRRLEEMKVFCCRKNVIEKFYIRLMESIFLLKKIEAMIIEQFFQKMLLIQLLGIIHNQFKVYGRILKTNRTKNALTVMLLCHLTEAWYQSINMQDTIFFKLFK